MALGMMSTMTRTFARLAGQALVGLLILATASPPAQAEGFVAGAVGTYEPDGNSGREAVYGLRGGYRFRPDLGIEGALAHVDFGSLADDGPRLPGLAIDLEADLWALDLSLAWYPQGGNFVVFAGPGRAKVEASARVRFLDLVFEDSASTQVWTAHAGVAYRWQLGESFFLRPEVRVRRYFDDEPAADELTEGVTIAYDGTDYEASLVFGWAFGR